MISKKNDAKSFSKLGTKLDFVHVKKKKQSKKKRRKRNDEN